MKSLKILIVLLAAMLVLASCAVTSQKIGTGESKPLNHTKYEEFRVINVIDGDTMKVLDGNMVKSLRFVGVDTPELHTNSKPQGELSQEAYEYTLNAITKAKNFVSIDFDQNREDKYARMLGYVYYKGTDGELHFLNKELIEKGLARPLFYNDSAKNKKIFVDAFNKAFEDKAGIFSKYDDKSIVKNAENLTDEDIGRIRWVVVKVKDVKKDGKFYKILSDKGKFVYSIREEEYREFYKRTRLEDFKDKDIKIYGEVWKESAFFEILGRAEFDIVEL